MLNGHTNKLSGSSDRRSVEWRTVRSALCIFASKVEKRMPHVDCELLHGWAQIGALEMTNLAATGRSTHQDEGAPWCSIYIRGQQPC